MPGGLVIHSNEPKHPHAGQIGQEKTVQFEMAEPSEGEPFPLNNKSQQTSDLAAAQTTPRLKTALLPGESLSRLLKQIELVLNIERSFLFIETPEQGELTLLLASKHEFGKLEPFVVSVAELAQKTASSGTPLLEINIDHDTRNIVTIPLFLSGGVLGVLVLVNKRKGHFSRSDIQLLNLLATCVTTTFENTRLHQNILKERERAVEAEDQARKLLAHNLHDGPAQLLSAIIMHLELCTRLTGQDTGQLAKELITAKSLARQAEYQVRTLLFELQPLILETQGLVAALEILLKRRQKDLVENINLKLKTKTYRSDGTISRQNAQVEAALFAIVQEAVNNAIKHAWANHVTVSLEETPVAIWVMIVDDGTGFVLDEVMNDYEQRDSLGLAHIRERAALIGGELTLKSAPGQGTQITVCVSRTESDRVL